jgi:hypothetical protein
VPRDGNHHYHVLLRCFVEDLIEVERRPAVEL